jgi:hypothetical protein
MSPLSHGDERARLLGGLFLLGGLHIAFFVAGNERATPVHLLFSFAVTSSLLYAAQQLRRRGPRGPAVSAPRAAGPASAPAALPSTTGSVVDAARAPAPAPAPDPEVSR